MINKKVFNNMQVKLMFFFFLVALVPLWAVGAFSIRTAEELILDMAANQIQQVVADKAALLERWISERKADIRVIAGTSILKSMDPQKIGAYLELVTHYYHVYDEFSVVTPGGTVVYDSFDKEFTPEIGTWLKTAAAGALYLSDICFNPVQKVSFFRISAPLMDGSGKIDGVVSATVGTNAILSEILQVALGDTGECYLVNRDGMFLAHREPGRILTENIAQSESFKNILNAEKKKMTYVDYRGIHVIGASARVNGTDWALVVEQDRDEAFQSADLLRRYAYLMIALSTCGALLSAILLSRYVAGPIQDLARAANHLARGEFERVDLKSDRGDEIGLLYHAFSHMAQQLRNRQHSLEETVGLREAELKETDGKLRETRQAVIRSQQLASLGRLAAGVAHEIRTPLTSLKLFLESVENEIEISLEYEEDFSVAMKQIQRMETTINRFLEFARPLDPVFTLIDVKELIEEALLVVGPRARQQETVIVLDMGHIYPKIMGDKIQLGEVLVNLMVNALEAITARGKITLGVTVEEESGETGVRRFVRVDVKDTGPGIHTLDISKLFDPFFTTKATGTGLGLSIAHSSIKRHGGEIRVKSNTNAGSVFSVLIPVSKERKD